MGGAVAEAKNSASQSIGISFAVPMVKLCTNTKSKTLV